MTDKLTADERYCYDCIHNEVCRWCPHDGCDFKETHKATPESGTKSREHGRWIRKHNSFPQRYYCTKCGEGAVGRFAFCPNCGARMGGDSHDQP